jgi:hypothetical protein
VTILVAATNAGVLGVSRSTYSTGMYRQLPGTVRRLHPRYRTPYVGIRSPGRLGWHGYALAPMAIVGPIDLVTTHQVAVPQPVTDTEAEYESVLVALESDGASSV